MENKKLSIVAHVNPIAGSCYHRIYTPLMNLNANVLFTNQITEEIIDRKKPEILILNRFAPFIPEGINIKNAEELRIQFIKNQEEIFEWKKKYGFKLVIDLDDNFKLNTGHILYDDWNETGISNLIINNLINADVVTVTHERLADSASIYNKNICILPNAIPKGFEQFNVQKVQSDKVRFVWQGSITHGPDVELLRGPMKRVSSDSMLNGKIQMIFGGHIKELIASNSMLDAYTCGLRTNTLIFPNMTPKEYYQVYNYADVGIIPLVDNKFNSYKSNLKILEAANAGIPVIVSQVNPYLDFPEDCVAYVKSQKDWYNHIKMFADIEYSRTLFATNLQEYCDKHYNFKTINQKRQELYESIR